jgi:uncharacterized protein (TIGR03000 family)
MIRLHQVLRSLPLVALGCVVGGVGVNEVRAAGPHGGGAHGGPHGAGAGHVPAFHGAHGFYGHGFYGHGYYRPYYGYPYGFYGFGIGFGVGYGAGWGFYGYPYPYYWPGYWGGGYYGNSYYMFGGGYPYYNGNYPYNGGGYPTYFPYGALAPNTSDPPPSTAASTLLGGGLPPASLGPPPSLQGPPPSPLPAGIGGPPAVPTADTEVSLIVRVPESATVWVNGSKTNQTGVRREFVSTGLTPGRTYTYMVRAQWTDGRGIARDADRVVTVQAGERRAIDFGGPMPPALGSVPPAPLAPIVPSAPPVLAPAKP